MVWKRRVGSLSGVFWLLDCCQVNSVTHGCYFSQDCDFLKAGMGFSLTYRSSLKVSCSCQKQVWARIQWSALLIPNEKLQGSLTGLYYSVWGKKHHNAKPRNYLLPLCHQKLCWIVTFLNYSILKIEMKDMQQNWPFLSFLSEFSGLEHIHIIIQPSPKFFIFPNKLCTQ